ncbi:MULTISPECIES: helix-turn-helix domain-containing protein [Agrobacterium]|uniref:helix-turn-helix domain-containing protein n=1 Tax=Agrobacterium TaxID=357 RepID=UPI0009D3880D|nr:MULTISPECIES: helix-turn-helix transcriptional regulator [Agrobacterium]CUX72179.1 putative Uncharacterized HTH-type transcriptional regulator y4wC [Agrobacterium sp. NCPPB 925]
MTSNNTPTDEDAKIGERIRKRREALKVTRKDFAAAFSISPGQISKYELGTNRVPADRIYKFADYLKVHVTYFFADFVSVEEVDRLTAFVGSPEGVELNTAFLRIGSATTRISVAALAAAIGG